MTGTHWPIEAGATLPASRRVFAVGRGALTDACGIEVPGGESCVLKTVGETIVIAGGRQRGTMYGVSLFLEKLGCRWFTADVARIPRLRDRPLADLNEIHSPAFEYREVFFTEAQGKEWSARNRLNGHFHKLDDSVGGKLIYMPFAHAFYDLVPPDPYFDSHPEYFALVSGTRRRSNAQLCLTNSDVLRIAVEQARQWLTTHPEVSIVSVSQNDGGGWCECEPCRQVIKEEGGAISGLALRFVNQVAAQLAVSHPDNTVDMLAYQETEAPPSTVRPLPNVQIRLCPILACQAHSYGTCDYNRGPRQRLAQWSRIAPRLYLWQYSINFSHYLAPFPNYDELAAEIPAFRRAGVKGIFVEGAVSDGGGGNDAELRSYLAAHLLWNPDVDVQAEIHGFMEAVYGPAASVMQSYFVLSRQEVRHGQHLWVDQNLDAGYLTPSYLKQGRILLQRASQKATTEAAQRRIARHLFSIDYVETMKARRCVIEGLSYRPRSNADTKKLLKTATRLGITNLREGYPIAQQVSDWGDVTRRYAAIVLGGAIVIPDLEARVISLGPVNILRVPESGELGYPNAGGIHVSLSEGTVKWQVESVSQDTLTLTGKTVPGRTLRMEIATAGNTLKVRVAVTNKSASTARLTLFCRADFACGPSREAAIQYRDQKVSLTLKTDGGVILSAKELPRGEWTLHCDHPELEIRNRFEPGQVARCGYNWSFRKSAGLTVTLAVATPEIELEPSQQFALTSEYDYLSSEKRVIGLN